MSWQNTQSLIGFRIIGGHSFREVVEKETLIIRFSPANHRAFWEDYMTTKPCPCCKIVRRTRKADDICYECREKINSVEKLKTLLVELGEKANFSMPAIVGPAPHRNKYFHFPGNSNLPRELQEMFFELVMAASIQSFEYHDFKETTYLLGKSSETDGASRPEAQRLINPEVAKWIMQLHGMMENIAREMYAFGQAHATEIIEKFNEIRKIVR